MTSDSNPFSPPPVADRRPGKNGRLGWLAAGALALTTSLFAGLWYHGQQEYRDLETVRARLAEANNTLAAAQAANQKCLDQIFSLQKQAADLETQKQNAVRQAKGLENEMRADLESRDVTISNLKGKLTVNILDKVMFDSGEAVLKPDGEAVLRKVAELLQKHPELKIHVIGHTDNVPIRAGARSRFASNWELSTARALAAVHFLGEQAGVDPRRMGAVGYGEFRPIADNANAEGRAKNRRIAIAILPEELAGAEPSASSPAPQPVPVPAAPPVLPTNASPVTDLPPDAPSNP